MDITPGAKQSYRLDQLPRSIWIPNFSASPACYTGEPLEILQSLANDLGLALGIDEAIEYMVQDCEDTRGVEIQIPGPNEAPEDIRAAILIVVLLVTGYAREVPQA